MVEERSSWHNGSTSMVEGSQIETVTMNNDSELEIKL